MYLLNTDYTTPEVTPEEIWKSLGWKDQKISDELREKTSTVIKRARELIRPKAVLLTGDLERDNESLTLFNLQLEGETIKNFMSTSDSAAVMAVTLGLEIDKEIKKLERVDLSSAVLLDTCASLLVETVCNMVSDELAQKLNESGYYTTERFSPGYSDLPLSLQPEILTVLDTPRKLGLTVTDSNLLIPRKSVTAFIGIMDQPREKRGRRCDHCILKGKCKYGICYYEG